MPAKILNSLTDENPELRKQFGCMTGMLQMFDLNRLLSGRRLNDGNHKKNPSGRAPSNSRGHRGVYNSSCRQNSSNENRRVSIDSSRVSCSSSSSSSSSSFFDCNKSMQQDAVPFSRTIFQEQSLKSSLSFEPYERDAKSNPLGDCQTETVQSCQQYHDLREVVKDSMQRDSKNLPAIKTSTWEEERDQAGKQRGSPRLSFLSKATEEACATGIHNKPKSREDLNESIRVLLKLKQAPLNFSEHATKDSAHQVARESPRFSCDGREFSRRLIDSGDNSKAISAKLRDLPRLSLGSREGSLRSSNLVSRANTLIEDLSRTTTTNTTPRLSNSSSLHEDPGSNKSVPGLVAKLMGLEELPNSWSSTAEEHTTKHMNGSFTGSPSAKSFKSPRVMKENQVCDSPKGSIKDSSASKTKVRGPSVKKSPRITTEAAPWIQQERCGVDRRTAVRSTEDEKKQRTSSVYSEILKKLEELEFRQPNKDLRALKQVLGVMHPKALLEAKKDEEQQPSTPTQGYLRDQNPARRHLTKTNSRPPRVLEPAKSVGRSGAPPLYPTGSQSGLTRVRTSGECDRNKGTTSSKTDKDQSPRVGPRLPNVHVLLSTDKQLGRPAGEFTAHQHRSNPALSLSKHQHCSKDDGERSSTGNSCSVSPRVLQRRAEAEKKHCLPGASYELSKAQKLSANKHQVESVSPRGKIKLKQAQILKIADKANESSTEAMKTTLNKKGDETIDNYRCFTTSPDIKPFKMSSETFAPKRMGVVANFVQKDMTQISTVGQVHATDSIISMCDKVNPDHEYVTEMLLAAGLLQNDGSKCRFPVQTRSPVQAIDPDWFYVLEQLKQNKTKPGSDKSRRKLVFDVANEILAQKLELGACNNILQFLVQDSKMSGQCLLQEVCSGIDQLQAHCSKKPGSMLDDDHDAMSGEDILQDTAGWTDFRAERNGMVLEIERSIFKDLISDIIGEITLGAGKQTAKPSTC